MSAGWSTGPAPAPRQLSPLTASALAHYGSEQQVLDAWKNAADALEKAKTLESALRLAVFEIKFPDPKEGVNRVDLNGGWTLKAQYPYSYKVTNKEGKTEKALDEITAISQQAGFIADRLIKWEPDISIKEYRLLNPDNPAAQTDEQKKILAILSPILTIKPGSPQLEIEAPKK